MTIEAIRFRTQDSLVVLQVCVSNNRQHSYNTDPTWRDAKVEDLLLVANHCKNKDDTRMEMLEYVFDNLRREMNEINKEKNS